MALLFHLVDKYDGSESHAFQDGLEQLFWIVIAC